MAPFNHFGAVFPSNNPSNPPSRRGREGRERSLQKETGSESIHSKAKDSASRRALRTRRRSKLFPRQASALDSDLDDDDDKASITESSSASATSEQASTIQPSVPVKIQPEIAAIQEPAAVQQTIATTPTPTIAAAQATATPTPATTVQPTIATLTSTISSSLRGPAITPIALLQNARDSVGPPEVVSESDDDGDDTTTIAQATSTAIPRDLGRTIPTSAVAEDLSNSAVRPSESDGEALPAIAGHPSLTPQAEHGLIAVGAIGGFLLIGFLVYMILRFRKVDVVGSFRRRRNRHKDEAWASKSVEESPRPGHGFSTFFNPVTQIRADPAPGKGLAQASSQRQQIIRNSLLHNAAPMSGTTLPPHRISPSIPFNLQHPPASRHVAAQRQSQRHSDLSSLSSGFGDAVIDVPESGPSPVDKSKGGALALPAVDQQVFGLGFGSRFSWANVPTLHTLEEHRKRDTMATTMSGESAPRFRTVKSWVDHQSSKLLRTQDSVAGGEREEEIVPDLPAIPETYSSREQHKRMSIVETNIGFMAHPGDEVEIQEGLRIASAVLIRKLRL